MFFAPALVVVVASAHISYSVAANFVTAPSSALPYSTSHVLAKRQACVDLCVETGCPCSDEPPSSPTDAPPPPPATTYAPPPPPPPVTTEAPPPPPPPVTTYAPPPPPPPVTTEAPPPPPPPATTEAPLPPPPPAATYAPPPPPPPTTIDSPPPSPSITDAPPTSPTATTAPPPPPPPVYPTTASLSTAISTAASSLSTTSTNHSTGGSPSPFLSNKNTATSDQLASTSPSSCHGNSSNLRVTNLAVLYHHLNRSIEYAMIVIAQESGISPRVRAEANTYGFKAPVEEIQLCDSGVSCPLQPQMSVTIRGEHKLDSNCYSGVPSHAWTMPDLEGSVLFTFFNNSEREIACVRVSLTNGATTQIRAIPFATGAVAILIILASGAAGGISYFTTQPTVHPTTSGHLGPHPTTAAEAHAAGGHSAPHPPTMAEAHAAGGQSGPPASHMDPTMLFLHFQSISTSGLLSLKYPPIYQSFTVNFAWSNFIIPLTAFRRAAKQMRKCDLDDPIPDTRLSQPSIPTVTSEAAATEASAGIPAYAAKLGISRQDIFGIAYIVFLCACAALLVIHLLVVLVFQIAALMASSPERKEVWLERRARWRQMSSNNSLRVLSLALGTLTTFTFYQLTQQCVSPVTAFACASALILTIGSLTFVTFLILRLATRPDGIDHLFNTESSYARRWGSLYDVLDHRRIYFIMPLWAVVILRSAIVGFGQRSGLAQVIATILLELTICIALFKFQPYYSPGYNRVTYMLGGTKAFSHILLLLFVDKLNINPVAKNRLGIVLLVVNSIVALVIVVLTVLKFGWGLLWFQRKHIAFQSEKQREKSHFMIPGSDDLANSTMFHDFGDKMVGSNFRSSISPVYYDEEGK